MPGAEPDRDVGADTDKAGGRSVVAFVRGLESVA